MSSYDLRATDADFREVANLLFGDGADELISKMNPGPSDLHVNGAAKKKDRRQRAVTAGLSAVGAGAGAYGLGVGANEIRRAAKRTGSLKAGLRATPRSVKALVPLELAGLGGEVMATKILHGDVKKKPINKSIAEIPESGAFPKSKGEITRAVAMKGSNAVIAAHKKGTFKRLPEKVKTVRSKVKKNEEFDVKWAGEISKVNTDRQQVFGWASIVEMNGEPVVDLQGDYITIDEVEKSAYEYVHKSRKGGDMHLRDNFGEPKVGSHMIESFVVTPDKKEALGLPEDTPTGWWVGFQVNDPELWAKVKSGERTGFSIHGRGVRTDAA